MRFRASSNNRFWRAFKRKNLSNPDLLRADRRRLLAARPLFFGGRLPIAVASLLACVVTGGAWAWSYGGLMEVRGASGGVLRRVVVAEGDVAVSWFEAPRPVRVSVRALRAAFGESNADYALWR